MKSTRNNLHVSMFITRCHSMKYGLTHWGQVTHICVSRITNIGSDNGLSPGGRQAIIWTNAEILIIETFGTNFSEIIMAIHTFSFKKMHLKMSSGKWRPFCLGLNVLSIILIISGSIHSMGTACYLWCNSQYFPCKLIESCSIYSETCL